MNIFVLTFTLQKIPPITLYNTRVLQLPYTTQETLTIKPILNLSGYEFFKVSMDFLNKFVYIVSDQLH